MSLMTVDDKTAPVSHHVPLIPARMDNTGYCSVTRSGPEKKQARACAKEYGKYCLLPMKPHDFRLIHLAYSK